MEIVYSDVVFVIPAARSRRPGAPDLENRPKPRRIYANKKLLGRCDYFHAMFSGGFREVEDDISDQVSTGGSWQCAHDSPITWWG